MKERPILEMTFGQSLAGGFSSARFDIFLKAVVRFTDGRCIAEHLLNVCGAAYNCLVREIHPSAADSKSAEGDMELREPADSWDPAHRIVTAFLAILPRIFRARNGSRESRERSGFHGMPSTGIPAPGRGVIQSGAKKPSGG